MITPKFSFNSINFTPTYPPTGKVPTDVNELVAVKHDSVASAGNKQSNTERIDEFQNLTFPQIPAGDLAHWRQLFIWGFLGNTIDYYPDSTDSGTKLTCWLEDIEFHPKFVCIGIYTLSLQLRSKVEATFAGS